MPNLQRSVSLMLSLMRAYADSRVWQAEGLAASAAPRQQAVPQFVRHGQRLLPSRGHARRRRAHPRLRECPLRRMQPLALPRSARALRTARGRLCVEGVVVSTTRARQVRAGPLLCSCGLWPARFAVDRGEPACSPHVGWGWRVETIFLRSVAHLAILGRY